MRNLSLSLLILLTFTACGSHDDDEGPDADEYFYDCENPAAGHVYATDESFAEFINKEAARGLKADDVNGPRLLTPAPGGTFSAGTPPMFTFKVGSMALRRPSHRPSTPTRPSRRESRWATVARWLSFEGTAYAHCGAVNGENYLFRVTKVGDKSAVYTALLSTTSFVPGTAKWSAALKPLVGQMVEITLARGVFSGGTLNDGPYVGTTPIRFTVGP